VLYSKDNSEFTGSVFHRINSRLETGVQVDWTIGSSETKFGVGTKYCPDRDTTIRVRISDTKNNSGKCINKTN